VYCNDCSRPVEYCICGAFSRFKDSEAERKLREFFTSKPIQPPSNCPDRDWCANNGVCYWDCQGGQTP
jgi:hypothetical protein